MDDAMSPALSPRRRFLEHGDRGELAFQRDPADGAALFPPRLVAPSGVEDPPWAVSAGLGTVHSTTCLRGKEDDRNLALIDMDEGFRLLSRVEGVAADRVRIGQRVRVRWGRDGGEPYPLFIPIEDGRADASGDAS